MYFTIVSQLRQNIPLCRLPYTSLWWSARLFKSHPHLLEVFNKRNFDIFSNLFDLFCHWNGFHLFLDCKGTRDNIILVWRAESILSHPWSMNCLIGISHEHSSSKEVTLEALLIHTKFPPPQRRWRKVIGGDRMHWYSSSCLCHTKCEVSSKASVSRFQTLQIIHASLEDCWYYLKLLTLSVSLHIIRGNYSHIYHYLRNISTRISQEQLNLG